MVEHSAPPPRSGGGSKLLVLVLLLLAVGVGVYMATRDSPPPAAPPPEPERVERSTSLVDPIIPIPEPEPEVDAGSDAGSEAPPEPETKTTRRPSGGSGGWSCRGDIAAAAIRKVVDENQAQVRSCYEKRLRINTTLRGSLTLQVKIGSKGEVLATRAKGSLNDPAVAECVQALAKSWRFPVPQGGACAVFEAPYSFTPKP